MKTSLITGRNLKEVINKMETFEEVQEYLKDIPCIDTGGCGVSLLGMYKWLKKNKDIEGVKFIFLYKNKSVYLNNEEILRNKRTGNPEAPAHCCLYYKGQFIDCKGIINMEKFTWFQLIDEEAFVKKAIDNKDTWNEMFDRQQILEIEKELEIDFSDIQEKE